MPYIICFLVSVAFAWMAEKSKDKFTIFVCLTISLLVLCILGGLREPFMGFDVKLYAWSDFCAAVASDSYIELLDKVPDHEAGYLLVCYIAAKIFGNINWALFFYQLIMMICFYIGAYRHKDKLSLPLLIFIFCCLQYNVTYDVMRQGMACGIIFMGSPLLEERKYLKFSLYIFVAYFFHTSALINFPLLLGVHMVMTSKTVLNNRWLNLFIFAGSILIIIFIMPVMKYVMSLFFSMSKYSYYLSSNRMIQFYSRIRLSRLLLIFAELILITLYRKKAETVVAPIGKGGVNFYQFALVFDIMYYLVVHILAQRILMYSDHMNFILLATLPRLCKEKHLKALIVMGLTVALLIYWWYTFAVKNANLNYPYRSILDK